MADETAREATRRLEELTDGKQSLIAVYPTLDAADAAVRRLGEAGLPVEQVSIIAKDLVSETRVQGFVTTKDVAKTGLLGGAWFGGLFGALAGVAALAVPGAGPLFILGPLAWTVVGAAEGAAAGGLVGLILGRFIEKKHIPKYEQHIEAGAYLLVFNGTEGEVARAEEILRDTGAIEIDRHDALQPAVA